uniref:NAD-dependent epimerase/dehydratase domain-containing protein n=1 Tax=viral metagenome TaxID=1070528 RepID=A0A6C0BTM2_9ZZZZ
MKILITGGSGLVGQAIQETIYLQRNNDDNSYINNDHDYIFISSKDCDLTNINDTKEYFSKCNPDAVIHLAAYVGGLFRNMSEKINMYEINTQINYNVLKVCDELNINRVLSCLSTCIFPDDTTYPINENMLHNGPPHFSNDAYAYSKRMLELHSRLYYENKERIYNCIIPTNIYGKYDNFNLKDAHVIPALIHKCYLAKKNNQPFIVNGSGTPLRQFIYSLDLAKLILKVLFEYYEKDPIILSVSEENEVSIYYVANTIAKCFGYENMIKFDCNYPDGQFKKTADNKKLMDLYPDTTFTSIENGISTTVEWFNVTPENLIRK